MCLLLQLMETELVHLVDELEHSMRHVHGFHRLQKASIIEDADKPPVLFFDLDNTLYPPSTSISTLMSSRISLFFQQYLNIPEEEAMSLGHKYYKDYGLAIKGIVRHFGIDPLQYDAFVDGGLQLDKILSPDNKLLDILRNCKARLFVFTNAGLKHALRVLTLLNLLDLFEAICYCDYAEDNFPAKPDYLAFERAMHHANIKNKRQCYFVDDGEENVRAAMEFGWNAVMVGEERENSILEGESSNDVQGICRIGGVHDLDQVFPELFK